MNKSALLTILGAAILSASKKKGSNSNLELMLKVGGFADGKAHVIAKITYEPMKDPRGTAGEVYFDLHEYIDPAIELVSALNLYRIENDDGWDDDIDFEVAEDIAKDNGGNLYTHEDSVLEEYMYLPIVPIKVDTQGVQSKHYNDYDIFELIRVDEIDHSFNEFVEARNRNQLEEVEDWITGAIEYAGLDPVNITEAQLRDVLSEECSEHIDQRLFDIKLQDLIEQNAFIADFIFDPKDYIKINNFSENLSKIMSIAYDLYLGDHFMDRNTTAGEVLNVEILSTAKPILSQLRKF